MTPRADQVWLWVDDSEGFGLLAEHALKGQRKLVRFTDSEEAVAFLHQGVRVDLVVLDYLMPGLYGADLVATVRRLLHETPIIVLSLVGEAGPERQACWDAGADEFLAKPTGPGELAGMLEEVAARWQV